MADFADLADLAGMANWLAWLARPSGCRPGSPTWLTWPTGWFADMSDWLEKDEHEDEHERAWKIEKDHEHGRKYML